MGEYKDDVGKVLEYFNLAKEEKLEIEVITTALHLIKDEPERYKSDVTLAMKDALAEWDINLD